MIFAKQYIHTHSFITIIRFVSLIILLMLTACGGGGSKKKSLTVSSRYSNYMPSHPKWRPPGPDLDPWGPYINQSSKRFNVPDQWIRAVMVQESMGYQYHNKRPVTSPHGAKGLMQLKTPTYMDMAKRYKLGKDPYDPHDNIMAGTAYIRTLYNKYGAPGFIAAYHGGPGTLDAHLKRGKALPSATKKYLASVAPKIGNQVPMSGPFASYAGPYKRKNTKKPLSLEAYYHPKSYKPTKMVARVTPLPDKKGKASKKIMLYDGEKAIASSSNKEPPLMIVPTAYQPITLVSKSTSPTPSNTNTNTSTSSKPHIVQVAYVPTKSSSSNPGNWGVQVGAFSSKNLAKQAANKAKRNASNNLLLANSSVESVTRNGNTLYRARLIGVDRNSATKACTQLRKKGMNCVTFQ